MVDPKGYSENSGGRDNHENANSDFDSRTVRLKILEEALSLHLSEDRYTERREPPDQGGGSRWVGYDDFDLQNLLENTLTDHKKFLLPQHAPGFALGTKEWSII